MQLYAYLAKRSADRGRSLDSTLSILRGGAAPRLLAEKPLRALSDDIEIG
jgi:hypothetical protein